MKFQVCFLLTFSDDESTEHEDQQQGEGAKRVSHDLRSPDTSNETEEGQGHLVNPQESQELLQEPEKDIVLCCYYKTCFDAV